jgi:hypothetical protein
VNRVLQQLQIVMLILVVFASGAWTGHLFTKTREEKAAGHAEVTIAPEIERMLPGPVRSVFERYVEDLDLDDAQQEATAPLFAKAARQMRGVEKNSPERFAILERFHERLAAGLRDEQQARAQKILEAARERVGQ